MTTIFCENCLKEFEDKARQNEANKLKSAGRKSWMDAWEKEIRQDERIRLRHDVICRCGTGYSYEDMERLEKEAFEKGRQAGRDEIYKVKMLDTELLKQANEKIASLEAKIKELEKNKAIEEKR